MRISLEISAPTKSICLIKPQARSTQQSRRSTRTDGFAFSPYDVGLGRTLSGVSNRQEETIRPKKHSPGACGLKYQRAGTHRIIVPLELNYRCSCQGTVLGSLDLSVCEGAQGTGCPTCQMSHTLSL